MRLIDADAIEKVILDNSYLIVHDGTSVEKGMSTYGIMQAFNEAPTIDAVPKWIPCSERLPEPNGKYLVTCDYIGKYIRILRYGDADFADKNPCWYFYDSEWGDVTVDNVLAWMPLPEPYKGVQE